jgi:hypothetical protein
MFNVYKNQPSRQTGSRNLMGPKTLPTIWGTYMKLVTKYQISAINSCWEYRYPISWEAFLDPSDSYFLFADFVDFYSHWTYILYMPIFIKRDKYLYMYFILDQISILNIFLRLCVQRIMCYCCVYCTFSSSTLNFWNHWKLKWSWTMMRCWYTNNSI